MMETPSKCPKCGQECTETNCLKGGRSWTCGTSVRNGNVDFQGHICLRIERDALKSRNAALDAALAEAVAVAGKWRAHHAEKGSTERATYWNDLAVRWQDARAEANQKGTYG